MIPSHRDVFARRARLFILLMGFLSSAVGTVGSFLLVDELNQKIRSLSDLRNGAVQEIDKLGGLASQYFIANQQGDLIFTLALQGSARQDLAALIYRGNLLDRAVPVRNLIGALAIAHLLDYRETYGAYERLSDAAGRATQDFKAFTAVKAYERDVVERAQKRVTDLQLGLAPLQQRITEAESALRKRQVFLLAFSFVGAFLLLLANLVEHRVRATAS